MNDAYIQYMHQLKSLFPVIGKNEKAYLKHISENLEIYCEENSDASVQKIYQEFGTPTDALEKYFSTLDAAYLSRYLNKKKAKRFCFLFCSVIPLVFSVVFLANICMLHVVRVKEAQELQKIDDPSFEYKTYEDQWLP